MGAGLAGSTTKLYGNANVNQIQYGDKLQGLPPVTGRRDPYRVYKSKAGGNAPDRFRIFCVNQLGGIGMGNKNSQFAPNADGVGWCPNRKNSREGDVGINKADRGHKSNRSQSRADEKAEFEIDIKHHEESVYSKEISKLKSLSAKVVHVMKSTSLSTTDKYNTLILLNDELDNMKFKSTGYELIWVSTYRHGLKNVIKSAQAQISTAASSNLVLLGGANPVTQTGVLDLYPGELDFTFFNNFLSSFLDGKSIKDNEMLYKQLDTIFTAEFLGGSVGKWLALIAPGAFTQGPSASYYQLNLGMGGPFPAITGAGGGAGFLLVAYDDGTIAFTCGGGFGTGSEGGNSVPSESELEAQICGGGGGQGMGGGGGMQCCIKGCKTDCTLYCSFGGGGILGFGDRGGGGTFFLEHSDAGWTQSSDVTCDSLDKNFDERIPNDPQGEPVFIKGIFDIVMFNKNLHKALTKCRPSGDTYSQCQDFCISIDGANPNCGDDSNVAKQFVKSIGNALINYMPDCPQ